LSCSFGLSPLLFSAGRPPRPRTFPLPPPLVALPTDPTLGALPLTENLAVPPTLSPLLGESRHLAPSSLLLQLSSALASPSLSQSRWHNSLRHRPLSRRGLSTTPPSRHLIGEPPPLAPCPARPPLNVGAHPGCRFPPRPPGCRQAPRHHAAPACGDRMGAHARPRLAPWASRLPGCRPAGPL
jgi:hypothetical protein